MGKFMKRISDGERVKIGTCEDLFYLRYDQLDQVRYDDDANPREHLDEYRFRFPWPDEDKLLPGEFEIYDRSCGLDGLKPPPGVEHGTVQFVSQRGFNMVIPCPEDLAKAEWRERSGLLVHRNGYAGAVRLVQQAIRTTEVGPRLVGICECGGCGHKFWLPPELAIEAADSLVKNAERREHDARVGPHFYDKVTGTYDEESIAFQGKWWRTVARRLIEGYSVAVGEKAVLS